MVHNPKETVSTPEPETLTNTTAITKETVQAAILNLLREEQRANRAEEVRSVAEKLMELAVDETIKESLKKILQASQLVSGSIPHKPVVLYLHRLFLRITFNNHLFTLVKKPDVITAESILSLVPHADKLIASWNSRFTKKK